MISRLRIRIQRVCQNAREMSFELRKKQMGAVMVVEIEGEFVLGPKLRRIASEIRNIAGVKGIVVDLAQCQRVDSAGMGELLMWYSILAKQQQRMLLAGVKESIRTMMRVARVDGILLCAEDRAAAVEELST